MAQKRHSKTRREEGRPQTTVTIDAPVDDSPEAAQDVEQPKVISNIVVSDPPEQVSEIDVQVTDQKPEGKRPLRRSWRHWLRARPLWGGALLVIAGLLVLIGPLSVQALAFSNPIFLEAWLVGTALILMGLLSIIAPTQALVAGSLGILAALASVLVAFGGYGIGVLLGLVGGSLCVAWRAGPAKSSNRKKKSASEQHIETQNTAEQNNTLSQTVKE